MDAAPVSPILAVWERQTQAGSSWFYWIAGLTLVNLVAAMAGSEVGFVLSLMPPMVAGYYAHTHSGDVVALVLAILTGAVCAGVFLLLGIFARKGARWAFITGMVLFAIDLVFWVLGQGWFSVIMHGYALWRIGQAIGPAGRLSDARRQVSLQSAWGSSSPAASQSPYPPAPGGTGVWPPAPQPGSAPAPQPLQSPDLARPDGSSSAPL